MIPLQELKLVFGRIIKRMRTRMDGQRQRQRNRQTWQLKRLLRCTAMVEWNSTLTKKVLLKWGYFEQRWNTLNVLLDSCTETVSTKEVNRVRHMFWVAFKVFKTWKATQNIWRTLYWCGRNLNQRLSNSWKFCQMILVNCWRSRWSGGLTTYFKHFSIFKVYNWTDLKHLSWSL